MKKLATKVSLAALGLVASMQASMAASINPNGICGLINELGGVFKVLRNLAFVGAAFVIAGWAWGYIKDGKGVDLDDARKKGVSLLVGFFLLFGMGTVITFIMSTAGQSAMGCNFSGW